MQKHNSGLRQHSVSTDDGSSRSGANAAAAVGRSRNTSGCSSKLHIKNLMVSEQTVPEKGDAAPAQRSKDSALMALLGPETTASQKTAAQVLFHSLSSWREHAGQNPADCIPGTSFISCVCHCYCRKDSQHAEQSSRSEKADTNGFIFMDFTLPSFHSRVFSIQRCRRLGAVFSCRFTCACSWFGVKQLQWKLCD